MGFFLGGGVEFDSVFLFWGSFLGVSRAFRGFVFDSVSSKKLGTLSSAAGTYLLLRRFHKVSLEVLKEVRHTYFWCGSTLQALPGREVSVCR